MIDGKIDRILVPLDGSETAGRITRRLDALLRLEDPQTTLLHVVDPEEPNLGTNVEDAEHVLSGFAAVLQAEGIACDIRVETGPAPETIAAVAESTGASLVAMSTHGRSGVARFLKGSVAEKVARICPAPLLVDRSFDDDGKPLEARPLKLRRILVPYDGSETALRVVPLTASLAMSLGAEVELIQVTEFADHKGMNQRTRHEIAHAVDVFAEHGIDAGAKVAEGEPAQQILDHAVAYEFDLIAMTTHGLSGFSRWLLGSVAERVLRHAPAPVLLINARTQK